MIRGQASLARSQYAGKMGDEEAEIDAQERQDAARNQ
jgi:hypothetical protein